MSRTTPVVEGDLVERADDAIIGFPVAGEDAQGETEFGFDPLDEGRAIGGFAHGAGGGGDDLVDAGGLAEAGEEMQGGAGALDGLRAQALGAHALAQAYDFANFVFEPEAVAGPGGEDHEAGGVGAEVDDGDARFGIPVGIFCAGWVHSMLQFEVPAQFVEGR